MPILKLEYNELSVNFVHTIQDIDKIYYLVVYTVDDFHYVERHFPNIKSALDFEPELKTNQKCLKLTFIYIISAKELDGNIYSYFGEVHLNKLKNKIVQNVPRTEWYKQTIHFDFIRYGYSFSVRLRDLDEINITKRRTNNNITSHNINNLIYAIRIDLELGKYSHGVYYELCPKFESITDPIFIEILYYFDIVIKNYNIDSKEQIIKQLKIAKNNVEQKYNTLSQELKKINIIYKKPTVIANEQGGILHSLIDPVNPGRDIAITLKQENKEALLTGNIELMSEFDCEPGHQLPGKIVTKEYLHPILENDETRYLKIKDGNFCKKNGQYIWSYSYYTHNLSEEDEIIEED